MVETEQILQELPKDLFKYEQKLRLCVDILKKDLSDVEKDKILAKARYNFKLHLDLKNYHTTEFTPDNALWHAVCSITDDRDLAEKTINACCLSSILLKKFFYPWLMLKRRFDHIPA